MEFIPHIIAILLLAAGLYLALSTRRRMPRPRLQRFWKTRPKSQPPQANQRPQTREPDPELTKRIQETRDAAQAQYLANIATQAETARNRADRNYRQYRAWRGDRHHGIQSTNNDKPAPKAPDCTSCRDTKSIIRGYDGRKIRCPRCR